LPFNIYENYNLLVIHACSSVSVLINKEAIKKSGLPIKEFFIWGNDIEYTNRISTNGFIGPYRRKVRFFIELKITIVLIFFLIILKILINYFYGIRNNLYMSKCRNFVKYFILSLYQTFVVSFLIFKKREDYKFKFIFTNIKATFASLFFNPQIRSRNND